MKVERPTIEHANQRHERQWCVSHTSVVPLVSERFMCTSCGGVPAAWWSYVTTIHDRCHDNRFNNVDGTCSLVCFMAFVSRIRAYDSRLMRDAVSVDRVL